MDYAEFLTKLEQTPRKWTLQSDGEIRCDYKGRDTCPLSRVDQRPGCLVATPARSLKLPLEDANEIASSADNDEGCLMSIRADLLRACGLSESQPSPQAAVSK